ncbi:DNA glycosylase [Prevotella sp. MGM2]|nr:DNA glycosylase [Prevotella sp. MGM2]
MDFFYPNFTNDMWRIMGLIFENDKDFFVDIPHKRFDQQKITDFAEHKGIALYDTATAVRRLRDNASDDFLEIVTPTDVKDMLAAMPQCTAVVTTGKKATDTLCGLFALQPPTIGGSVSFFHAGRQLTFFRMPSSSRAYPLALPKKAETYRKMFEQLSLL